MLPAGFIGFAGLADGVGPRGWLGMAEFIGWMAVCVAAHLAVAALLGQWRTGGVRRYASLLMAFSLVAGFTFAAFWLVTDAPMAAKVAFTTTLQAVGTATSVALLLWLGWMAWSGVERV